MFLSVQPVKEAAGDNPQPSPGARIGAVYASFLTMEKFGPVAILHVQGSDLSHPPMFQEHVQGLNDGGGVGSEFNQGPPPGREAGIFSPTAAMAILC